MTAQPSATTATQAWGSVRTTAAKSAPARVEDESAQLHRARGFQELTPYSRVVGSLQRTERSTRG
jgi:hypothetical protein